MNTRERAEEKRKLISSIHIDKSNFEFCANNNLINGTLYLEICRIMEEYANIVASLPVVTEEEIMLIVKYFQRIRTEDDPDVEYLFELDDLSSRIYAENRRVDFTYAAIKAKTAVIKAILSRLQPSGKTEQLKESDEEKTKGE